MLNKYKNRALNEYKNKSSKKEKEEKFLKKKVFEKKKYNTKMKKIILILLLLFSVNVYSQIDTSIWSLTRNSSDGKYSLITNKLSFGGVGAGTITVPLILTIADIDTSKYSLLRNNIDGKYSTAINKTRLYGIDSGLIKVSVSYNLNQPTAQSLGIDTSKILDPADFAGGKIIQEHNGVFVPSASYDVIKCKELLFSCEIDDEDGFVPYLGIIYNNTGYADTSFHMGFGYKLYSDSLSYFYITIPTTMSPTPFAYMPLTPILSFQTKQVIGNVELMGGSSTNIFPYNDSYCMRFSFYDLTGNINFAPLIWENFYLNIKIYYK